jgi:hypothetical protein
LRPDTYLIGGSGLRDPRRRAGPSRAAMSSRRRSRSRPPKEGAHRQRCERRGARSRVYRRRGVARGRACQRKGRPARPAFGAVHTPMQAVSWSPCLPKARLRHPAPTPPTQARLGASRGGSLGWLVGASSCADSPGVPSRRWVGRGPGPGLPRLARTVRDAPLTVLGAPGAAGVRPPRSLPAPAPPRPVRPCR